MGGAKKKRGRKLNDARLMQVEVEFVPWTPETWERHVAALAELVEELDGTAKQTAKDAKGAKDGTKALVEVER